MDCSPPGSFIHEIFYSRVLEWVAISFCRGSSQPRDSTQVSSIVGRCFTIWTIREVLKKIPKWKSPSCVSLFVTPWTSPGQNTGISSLSLLQGIFPTQGLNPDLLHCRQILYQLSHQGSPRTLKWVAYPFSSGSSQLRNWNRVSWIADGFFTSWAGKLTLGTAK